MSVLISKKLTVSEAQDIANLHESAFKNFFLTSLGNKFLNRFYKAIIAHPHSIAIGIYEDNILVGFAIGSKIKQGFYSSIIKQHWMVLLCCSFNALISNPQRAIRLVTALTTKYSFQQEILNSPTLLSICVSPEMEGRGIGKLALKSFEEIAFKFGFGISLTTDAYKNVYVNYFYQNNEYQNIGIFRQGDRLMNLYFKMKT